MKKILTIALIIICSWSLASQERDEFLYKMASVTIGQISFSEATLPDAIESIEKKWNELTGENLSIAVVYRTDEMKERSDITITAKDLPFLEMLSYICEMSGASLKVMEGKLFIEQISFSGQCNCRGLTLSVFEWNKEFASTLGLPVKVKESDIHQFLSQNGIQMDNIKITFQPDFMKLFIAGTQTDISDINHVIRLRKKGYEIKKITTSE